MSYCWLKASRYAGLAETMGEPNNIIITNKTTAIKLLFIFSSHIPK
ncbi:hypothetical protein Mpsy_0394 [Methanolobus psychrophilus R15]|nr:hypothetical protein Mpsy_0394 [Methanolobus psychrophilus R15]